MAAAANRMAIEPRSGGAPLRVLALMRYGAAAASTRQRLLQYLPYLQAQGIEVEVDTLLSDAYVHSIAAGAPRPKLDILRGYARRLRAVARAPRYDALWVHFEAFPKLPLEGLLGRAGVPIIVDMDDGFHLRAGAAIAGKYPALWSRAALCLCGNEVLARDVEPYARSLTVPTVLDTDIWTPAPARGERKVVGWIGSPSNWRYVEPLLPVIRAAIERHGALFRTVGAGPEALRHPWIDARPWSAETELAEVQGFDVGLMPLADDAWTRRKCGYKLIQYMACGVPAVGSPVGVNRELLEETGLAASGAEEWQAAIERLLGDQLLARRCAGAGREKVVRNYSLAAQQERVAAAIRSACAPANRSAKVIADFGREWAAFDQFAVAAGEQRRMFDGYFSIFPFDELGEAEGFDLGCGSGRWAELVAPLVGKLHCIDPAPAALDVARRRLAGHANVSVRLGCATDIPLADASQDFGYCLGVLHHIPDPEAALRNAVAKLKPGAPFLAYIYYALEIRPWWFRGIWRSVDVVRRATSRLPFPIKKAIASAIAGSVYWPLARLSRRTGPNTPLAHYARASFYTMRTDALDRFGTRLEQRFTRAQIEQMLRGAGLTDIRFSDGTPYWVVLARKGQVVPNKAAATDEADCGEKHSC